MERFSLILRSFYESRTSPLKGAPLFLFLSYYFYRVLEAISRVSRIPGVFFSSGAGNVGLSGMGSWGASKKSIRGSWFISSFPDSFVTTRVEKAEKSSFFPKIDLSYFSEFCSFSGTNMFTFCWLTLLKEELLTLSALLCFSNKVLLIISCKLSLNCLTLVS